MKFISVVLSALVFSFATQSCNSDAQSGTPDVPKTVGGAKLTLDKEVHDYGVMNKGADGNCVFKVTNTGDQPLIISECKKSCGCTVPHCDTEPVLPGATSEIKVTYDTQRTGVINKSITVISNSKDEETKVLRITGEVIDPDAAKTTEEEKTKN